MVHDTAWLIDFMLQCRSVFSSHLSKISYLLPDLNFRKILCLIPGEFCLSGDVLVISFRARFKGGIPKLTSREGRAKLGT